MEEHHHHPPYYDQFDAYDDQQILTPDMYAPQPASLHQPISPDALHDSLERDEEQPGPSRARPRPRRQKSATGDHVKHRRTRSGCFTCRQRRVKCDESRPTCDRCRKGKRDCVYPENPPSSSKSSRHGPSSLAQTADSDSAHSSEESVGDATAEQPRHVASGRHDSQEPKRWASHPREVRFFLRYHRQNLSYHHYALKHDNEDFFKTSFLEEAVNFEPLLYAVVAFSAYFYAVSSPGANIRPFFDYYDKSVSLFRKSLARSESYSVATLLTMLQLSTIEEFLGDWVNLLSHQRAACRIISDLYTPQTIMQSETHRIVILWYLRFDLYAGLMSGGATILGREWFAECSDFYVRRAQDNPDDPGARHEGFFNISRLLGTDVALLCAAKASDSIEDDAFRIAAKHLWARMKEFRHRIENDISDESCFIHEWTKEPHADDLTDYTDPHFTYSGPNFPMNYVLVDAWALVLMFRQKLAMLGEQDVLGEDAETIARELYELALKNCKMFEAIQYSDQSPPGAILGCHASIGIASIFLPKDKQHIDWCRRQFAVIESAGYIYPPTFRQRMTQLWGEDVTHWWLPNDEGFPPIIRSMRDFIVLREQSAGHQTDAKGADVRDLNGVFRSMQLEGRKDSLGGVLGASADAPSNVSDSLMDWASSPEHT